MPSLRATLNDESRRDSVVSDCCTLIDQEVADRGGLSGAAIKAGYRAVQGVKPGFVKRVVGDLLPEFSDALDPIYQEALAAGKSVSAYFDSNAARAADSLLGITDDKAARSTNKVVKGAYGKLRKMAKKNVEGAVPRLGRMIEAHTV